MFWIDVVMCVIYLRQIIPFHALGKNIPYEIIHTFFYIVILRSVWNIGLIFNPILVKIYFKGYMKYILIPLLLLQNPSMFNGLPGGGKTPSFPFTSSLSSFTSLWGCGLSCPGFILAKTPTNNNSTIKVFLNGMKRLRIFRSRLVCEGPCFLPLKWISLRNLLASGSPQNPWRLGLTSNGNKWWRVEFIFMLLAMVFFFSFRFQRG